MELKDIVRERLCELITDSTALRQHLECSPQAINQYKKGVTYPSIENLCKIADYYGVSVDFILGRTDDPILVEGGRYYEERKVRTEKIIRRVTKVAQSLIDCMSGIEATL